MARPAVVILMSVSNPKDSRAGISIFRDVKGVPGIKSEDEIWALRFNKIASIIYWQSCGKIIYPIKTGSIILGVAVKNELYATRLLVGIIYPPPL